MDLVAAVFAYDLTSSSDVPPAFGQRAPSRLYELAETNRGFAKILRFVKFSDLASPGQRHISDDKMTDFLQSSFTLASSFSAMLNEARLPTPDELPRL